MKKIKSMIVCAVFGAMCFAGYFSYGYIVHNEQDDLLIMNVEALTKGEDPDCPGRFCSYSSTYKSTCSVCCPYGKTPSCSEEGCSCK